MHRSRTITGSHSDCAPALVGVNENQQMCYDAVSFCRPSSQETGRKRHVCIRLLHWSWICSSCHRRLQLQFTDTTTETDSKGAKERKKHSHCMTLIPGQQWYKKEILVLTDQRQWQTSQLWLSLQLVYECWRNSNRHVYRLYPLPCLHRQQQMAQESHTNSRIHDQKLCPNLAYFRVKKTEVAWSNGNLR